MVTCLEVQKNTVVLLTRGPLFPEGPGKPGGPGGPWWQKTKAVEAKTWHKDSITALDETSFAN